MRAYRYSLSLFRKPEMPGIEGECAAGGSFSEAKNEPSMGGLTKQANVSEACDNQTEWAARVAGG